MADWKFESMAHGGDYNPDQWRHIPGTWDEDVRLMKKSHCNLMSVGIFSWAALEPEEGVYDFGWLEEILNKLYENGVHVLLATPSGARPAWMAQKYPEVLRVNETMHRNLYGTRQNHCYTSPTYRMFVERINRALAERFGNHPAVVGWHISNEYGGACYCPLCQNAFRRFLKKKYGTLEHLNHEWWTGFWAKTYTDWSQIEAPVPHGEGAVHGLNLDWKRFVTYQTRDFMRHEIAAVREFTPDLPVTTNMMGMYDGLDYFRFKDDIDFASYDSYPCWGAGDDAAVAMEYAMIYDLTRNYKDRTLPWILMESTPSMTNWQPVCKPKRPGMHLLSSMQTVAHGADGVMYFQWRKSRGACEKLHGAVVDHCGHENTRVFREVTQVGETLEKLQPVHGAKCDAKAAVVLDWNNRWAIADAQGPRKDKRYEEIVTEHYRALKSFGVDLDVIDMEQDFTPYKLVVLPMLYMVKPGVAERLEAFVKAGGAAVFTYWCGMVNENDLCFLGGFPGPLKNLMGVWIEETDALYPGQKNAVCFPDGRRYECDYLCDVIHAESAQVLATYESDYYAGQPALTEHRFGEGRALFIAAHTGLDLLRDLYGRLLAECGLNPEDLPEGVNVARRYKDGKTFRFTMNFLDKPQQVCLPKGRDLVSGQLLEGETVIPPLGFFAQEEE